MSNVTHVWGYPLFSRVMQEDSGIYTVLKLEETSLDFRSSEPAVRSSWSMVIHLQWVRSPPPAWLGHSICSLLLPRVTYTEAASELCVPSLRTAGLKVRCHPHLACTQHHWLPLHPRKPPTPRLQRLLVPLLESQT